MPLSPGLIQDPAAEQRDCVSRALWKPGKRDVGTASATTGGAPTMGQALACLIPASAPSGSAKGSIHAVI